MKFKEYFEIEIIRALVQKFFNAVLEILILENCWGPFDDNVIYRDDLHLWSSKKKIKV